MTNVGSKSEHECCLHHVGANHAGCADDDEFVNVDLVPLHELIDAVLDGKIEDAKTVVGALACDSIAHRLGGTEL